ncbi:PaaI family thioesterase [Thermoanaerobacterium sp. DL9XJH110]|uniref:PaaI family thioesterase n=1 Tax=Thermoanaerobacterium sp. DL9XJH110 TaxID=3386643 RepID=UPI003BB62713
MKAVNRGIDESLFNEIVEKTFPSPYHLLLGFELIEIERGKAVVRMDAGNELLNAMKIVHGGATASLCDTAMGFAARSLGAVPTTVEMKVNYLAPGLPGEKLTAVGKVIKEGKNLIVTEGEIFDKRGKLIVKSSGTYFDLRN